MPQETIEQLTVDLDLNTREFDRKSKKAEEALRDTRNRTAHTARSMSLEGTRAASFFKPLIAGAIGFIGVTTGSRGLINFAKNMTDSAASLGRFSAKVGVGVKDVQAWRMAADEMGISADGMDSALKVMSDAKNQYLATGETPAWMKPFNIKMDSPDSMLLQLAENSKHLDASMRNFAFEQNGLGAIAPMLMMQRSEIESIINLKKQNNLLDERQVKKAQELQAKLSGIKTQVSGVGREIYEMLQPKIEKALEALSGLIGYARAHKSELIDFFSGVGAVIGGVFVSGLLAAATPLVIIGAKIAAVTAAIGFLKSDHDKWLSGSKSFVNWELWEVQAENAKAAISKVQASIKEHGGVIAAVRAETSEFIDVNGYQQQANDITRIFDGLIALNDRYGFSFTRLTKDWKEFKDMMSKLGEIKLFDGDKEISLGKLIGNFTDGLAETAKDHLHWAANKVEEIANDGIEPGRQQKSTGLKEPTGNKELDRRFEIAKPLIEETTAINGVDAGTLTRVMVGESGLNFESKNGLGSSAFGIGQFMPGTWKEVFNKHAKKYGLTGTAEQNKHNKKAQIAMAGEYVKEGLGATKRISGGDRAADAYAYYNLGSGSGVKFLSEMRKNDGQKVKDVLKPSEIKMNPVLYKDGNITLREAYGNMTKLLDRGRAYAETFKQQGQQEQPKTFGEKLNTAMPFLTKTGQEGEKPPLAARHSAEAKAWEDRRNAELNAMIASTPDHLKFTGAKMPTPKPEWVGGQQNTSTTEINIDNINISGTKIKDADSLVSGLRERVNKSVAVHGVRAME